MRSAESGRDPEMKTPIPFLALACLALCLTGCGGDSDQSSAPTPTPTPLPLYNQCIATDPVDPGNPNHPVIAIKGAQVVNLPLGTPYVDAGATATDPAERDITGRIVVSGLDTLNVNTVTDYLIRYNVTNSSGLRAAEKSRIVRVTDGTFAAQAARDIGTTGAHMGYYEHLPVHYSDDPNAKFPLIVFIHGWGRARFLNSYTVQTPLSSVANANLAGLINGTYGSWDASRPFIVLSPQKCVDELIYGTTAERMKLLLDYAINTYKVDTSRIYMGGHSQGSGDTWDYVNNYPLQLAAVFPISGGYGTVSGCQLKNTPAWAFNGQNDTVVPYQNQVDTVNSINACNPPERAKVTVLPGADHDGAETEVVTLSGLGQGLAPYDIYNQSIYDWLLAHSRPGVAPHSVRADIRPAAAHFAARPEEVVSGQPVSLTWSFPGATACTASGDWLGARAPNGSQKVAPAPPGQYNYVLTCSGPAGNIAQTATVTVYDDGSVPGHPVPLVKPGSSAGSTGRRQ